MLSFLTNTNLVSLHDHINRLSIETDAKCVKALVKIRQDEKRRALVYDSEVDTSIKLCTMKVKACEQVHESIYTVTDDDDVTSRTVNLLVATGAPHSACANVLSKHFVKVKEMSGLYQIITLSIWYSFI